MVVSMASIGSSISNFAGGWLKWILVFIGLFVFLFISLTIKRNRKFKFPTYVHVSVGDGKDDMYPTVSGWFRKKRMLGGRIEMGGEFEMVTKDWTKIFNVASEDYQFMNGMKCLHVQRDKDDPEILCPIKYIRLDKASNTMMDTIAPADYRDAAVQILERKQAETSTWWDKHGQQLIMLGAMVIVFIIFLLTAQWSKHENDATREMLLKISEMVVKRSSVAP